MAIEANSGENQSAAIILLKQRLSKFETEEGRLHNLAYKPRPNDVGISTSPKAGTTWVQQICHQIRCAKIPEKCMDFEEISSVVPWIELAFDQGQDLEADQPPFEHDNFPRLFKTHCWYNHCPPFPKTIVVFRDPCDVLLSFFCFFEGWFFEPGAIDLETFADEFWMDRGVPDDTKMQNASYFVHLISWYEQRHVEPSLLFVFYEDLVDNLEAQVRRIAKFLSNEHHNFDTEQVIQHTVQHSSFSFMKQHESHFDEKLSKLARNEACGLPKNAGMSKSKVNTGKIGVGASTLSERLRSKIQQKWDEVVRPVSGCATYSELRKQFAAFNK
jgi:Sulfotransferase domain